MPRIIHVLIVWACRLTSGRLSVNGKGRTCTSRFEEKHGRPCIRGKEKAKRLCPGRVFSKDFSGMPVMCSVMCSYVRYSEINMKLANPDLAA
eukprot:scaffold554857_cov17-Prasinocladus_malaysianus.AAC.1